MKIKQLDTIIEDLEKTWDLTTEQLNDVRQKMIEFAFCACVDSDVAKKVLLKTEQDDKK